MTRRVAGCGILIGAAMVLSYIEVLIPLDFGIPGVKLGLANLAVLLTLYPVSYTHLTLPTIRLV